MRVDEFYRQYLNELKVIYGAEEAAAITAIIFENFASISRSDVLINGNREIESSVQNKLEIGLKKLLQHVPVQYITGKAWFCGAEYNVNSSVLIPRPETEELVLLASACIQRENKNMAVDIGTGSGCIAIALKKQNKNVEVSALDISETALLVAKQNAELHSTDIIFYNKDFLDNNTWKYLPSYDVIISNPPYIPLSEAAGMDKHVSENEPGLALFVPNEDPLIFYRKIAVFAQSHLRLNGKIFVETHMSYANDVADVFRAHGFECGVHEDMFGKPRIVEAGRK